jgi:hypothetical protein
MAYTDKQKAMWEETNNTLNAMCAIGMELRHWILPRIKAESKDESYSSSIKRLSGAIKRITECQRKLQNLITEDEL